MPAAKVRSVFENGTYTCLRDNSIADLDSECPQVDTTFVDCFKVTTITNMTMMGSGVEYGQKVYTWLAKDQGIVKSDLFAGPRIRILITLMQQGRLMKVGKSGQASRIELAEINVEKSGNVFRRLSSPAQIVKMEDFKDIPDFDHDPYKISNQTGFHTINFDEDLR